MPEKICARCNAPNQDNANFCHQCGWRAFGEVTTGEDTDSPVATKACPMCGNRNPESAGFCPQCGNQLAENAPQEQQGGGYPYVIGTAPANALLIGSTRLIVLSIISLGLYFYYWGYLTWKQLQPETQDVHYPVWHALSLLVPVYGFFRMHKHVKVIRDLAAKSGVETSLSPDLAFVLMMLYTVLVFAPLALAGSGSILLLFVNAISLTIAITIIVWAQAPLNRYWENSRSSTPTSVPVDLWEIGVVLLGIIGTVVVNLLPAPA